jgi:hypothetical protein
MPQVGREHLGDGRNPEDRVLRDRFSPADICDSVAEEPIERAVANRDGTGVATPVWFVSDGSLGC